MVHSFRRCPDSRPCSGLLRLVAVKTNNAVQDPSDSIHMQLSPAQIWDGMFYMGHFDGPTPKRHRLWSNCKDLIDTITERAGFMSREEMRRYTQKTVVRYTDSNGVKRHTGKPKELQKSQPLDANLMYSKPVQLLNPKSCTSIGRLSQGSTPKPLPTSWRSIS